MPCGEHTWTGNRLGEEDGDGGLQQQFAIPGQYDRPHGDVGVQVDDRAIGDLWVRAWPAG